MSDLCRESQNSVANQGEMFRLAERDHGLSLNILHHKSGIPYNTLRSWRDGTVMPAWALFKLGRRGGVPAYLLSFVGEPFEHAVVAGRDETDLDAIAEPAGDYAHEYQRARHPHSPGGVAIVPQEAANLHDIRRRMVGEARA